MRSYVRCALSCAVFLAVWQCLSLSFGGLVIASPLGTARAVVSIVSEPGFAAVVLRSSAGVLLGFVLCAVCAALAALASFYLPSAETALAPFVSLMKSVPIAVVAILLLMIFSGSGISPAAVFLASFPILYTSFLSGARSADEKLLQMARVFGWGAVRTWRFIRLPAAEEQMESAFSVSSAMAWKAGIAAEVIGAPPGSIGAALQTAKIYLMTDELFAWAAVILALGYATELISLCAVRTMFGIGALRQRVR